MDPALSSIVERVKAAAASGRALRIRGGGSKDFYGEPSKPGAPGEPGVSELLETTRLTGIVSYEPSELVVTVRAGTPLAHLEAALAECGQCLPFDPPRFGGGSTSGQLPGGDPTDTGRSADSSASTSANTTADATASSSPSTTTIGGVVATGLAGPARASVGSVRDYVLGVDLLNGRGELLTFGGQVMKNVAGYDVSRLMVGALGTLGLIVQVSLKVLALPPAEATLKFEMNQTQALKQLNTWGGQPLPLDASCWVNDAGMQTLYLRLRGAVAAVEAACKALGGERQDNALVAPDWSLCRDQQLPWFQARGVRDLWRLSVPQTAPALDLPEPPLVEWHGGQRWVRAERGDAARLRQAAADAGGHATLFIAGAAHAAHPAHATDAARSVNRFDALKPPLDRIHRELKRQFDPAGIFNRGRLYPDF